ncbi:hypothetical protein Pcac1_g1551 [Phytophthora cactorum]|nr:hypothetical protein Pcac1_g1551 [Phytophthora cactorum]
MSAPSSAGKLSDTTSTLSPRWRFQPPLHYDHTIPQADKCVSPGVPATPEMLKADAHVRNRYSGVEALIQTEYP